MCCVDGLYSFLPLERLPVAVLFALGALWVCQSAILALRGAKEQPSFLRLHRGATSAPCCQSVW